MDDFFNKFGKWGALFAFSLTAFSAGLSAFFEIFSPKFAEWKINFRSEEVYEEEETPEGLGDIFEAETPPANT